MNSRFTRYLIIWVLLISTVWIGDRFIRGVLLTADEPRPVTPRGELAPIERMTSELFANVAPSVAYIFTEVTPSSLFGAKESRGGAGSGFIWDRAGHVVTNFHVIQGASRVGVRLDTGEVIEAKVIGVAPDYDLAVVRLGVNRARLRPISIGTSADLKVGQMVFAIGNPFGLSRTLTTGIISALNRRLPTATGREIVGVIQTDAAINPGNSGGALVSLDGRLVGINTAIYSKSGGSVGIGFAIPSNMVKAVLRSALTGKPLVRPWLGAQGQDVTADIAASLGLERIGGVILSGINVGGPADKAGLKKGDVVTAINGRELINGQSLRFRLALLEVGGTAALTVYRDGRKRRIEVTLVAPPEVPLRNVTTFAGASPFAGATVANLSPRLAYELGTGTLSKGVIILKVARGSPAHRLRMARGDLVIHVNGHDIARVGGLRSLTDRRSERWLVRLRRRGQVITLRIGG